MKLSFSDLNNIVPGSIYDPAGWVYYPADQDHARFFPGSRSAPTKRAIREAGFGLRRMACGTYRVYLPTKD